MSSPANEATGAVEEAKREKFTTGRALAAGVLAGIGASVCCVGPFVLLLAGISGAWIGTLAALEPYRPFFIGVTLLFLALAFRKLYIAPRICAPGAECASPKVLRRQRVAFWSVTALLGVLLPFPWYAPLLLA